MAPKSGSRWRHHHQTITHNHYYPVIGIANTGNKNPAYPPEVVYQGDNGFLWTKKLDQWPGSLFPAKEVNVHTKKISG